MIEQKARASLWLRENDDHINETLGDTITDIKQIALTKN